MKSLHFKASILSLSFHGVLALILISQPHGNSKGSSSPDSSGSFMAVTLASSTAAGTSADSSPGVPKPLPRLRAKAQNKKPTFASPVSPLPPSPSLAQTEEQADKQSGIGSLGSRESGSGKDDGSEGVRMIAQGRPDYPPLSRRLGEQGDVILRFRIDTTGDILNTILDNSSGYPRLDRSALNYSKTVRFLVTRALTHPIEKRVTFVFRLQE